MYANDFINIYAVGVDANGNCDAANPNNSKGLASLVYNEYLKTTKIFVCRSTKNKTADSFTDLVNGADTADGGSKSDERSSYLYIGGFATTEVSAEHGIARDKNKNHGKFGNVLFGDVHVDGFQSGKKDDDAAAWWKTNDHFGMNPISDDDNFTVLVENSLWPTETTTP